MRKFGGMLRILIAGLAGLALAATSAAQGMTPPPSPSSRVTRPQAGMLAAALQGSVTGSVLTASTALSGPRGEAFNQSLAGYCKNPYPEEAGFLPAVVLQPQSTADIVRAVEFARSYQLPIGVKGGGQSSRNLWIADGGLTIDMGFNFRGCAVDPVEKTVSVQGGATYLDICGATSPYNLALPWGTTYTTGMGLALNGGIGLSMRAYGLAADNLINATVITANGTLVTASKTQNPDLLQAMRGAGTVFGVVVEAAFHLHDMSNYYGGTLTLVDDPEGANFRAVWNWTVSAMAAHPLLGVQIIKGTSIIGEATVEVLVGYPGNAARGEKAAVFSPLQEFSSVLEDSLGNLDYFQTELVQTNASFASPYQANYVVGATVSFDQVNDEWLDFIHSLATKDLPKNVSGVLIVDFMANSVIENAIAKGYQASFTPFGSGDVDAHISITFAWPTEGANKTEIIAIVEKKMVALEPYVLQVQPYTNLATFNTEMNLTGQVGGSQHLVDLQRLKRQLDPHNVFPNHSFVGLYQSARNGSGVSTYSTSG